MKKDHKKIKENSKYLTIPEAANALNCHPNKVRAMIRKELLRPQLLGSNKVPMIPVAQVEHIKRPLEKKGMIAPQRDRAWPMVAIGASAGGSKPLVSLLASLPENLGLPYVVISHMEAGGEKLLLDMLKRTTPLPLVVIENGMSISPDQVHIAPGGTQVSISNSKFHLSPSPNGRTHASTIDIFFRSIANEYGSNAIGIILSGTGTDGTEGARAIKGQDGVIIAQDGSALQQTMPTSARNTGVVDMVRAPEAIGRELVRLLQQLYSDEGAIVEPQEKEIGAILQLIHEKKGVDLTSYKKATVDRRVIRRMILAQCDDLKAYSKLLRSTPAEVDTLLNDLLINVTSFFRDEKLFRELRAKVLPELLADHKQNQPLRIWVPACAGGEEVVSIAITLLELLGDRALTTPVQLFATDLNERTIEKARLGVYRSASVKTLPPEYVTRYFIPVDGHYQVIKSIRDMCVFARHDLLKDPPFSKLDLISCQNVLIYLENDAQGHVLKKFHYALRPSGFLLLGKAETTVPAGDIFVPFSKEARVYRRRALAGERIPIDVQMNTSLPLGGQFIASNGQHDKNAQPADLDGEVEKVLLRSFVPAGVVVNKDLEIVRFKGDTSNFLRPSTGKASLNLLKMVRNELAMELRPMLYRARREKTAVNRTGITIDLDGKHVELSIDVLPVNKELDPHFLVLFRETGRSPIQPARRIRSAGDTASQRIAQLEEELREARKQMQLIAEESETANQDLQAANEEIVSSNEELQSINEELETSKEELQSINEEFATINEELQARNDALQESEERLRLATRTGRVGIWDWDIDADRITWSEALFQMHGISRDRFEPTLDAFLAQIHPPDRTEVKKALERSRKKDRPFHVEYRIKHPDGSMRWLFTNGSVVRNPGKPARILGAILDITELKRTELTLQQRTGTLEILNKLGDELIADLQPESIAQRVVNAACEITQVKACSLLWKNNDQIEEFTAKGIQTPPLTKDMVALAAAWAAQGAVLIADLKAHTVGRRLKDRNGRIMPSGSHLSIPITSRDGSVLGGLFLYDERIDRFTQENVDAVNALGAQAALALDNAQLHTALIHELEEQKRIEAELRESRKSYQELVEMMPVGVYACDENGVITLYNKAISEIWGREPKIGIDRWVAASKLRSSEGKEVRKEDSAIARSMELGVPLHDVEVIHERSDGEQRHVIVNPTPVFGQDGSSRGMVNVVIDITERKHTEAERERLSNVLARSLNEIYIFDLDTLQFQYVNESALKNLGYSLAQMRRMTPIDIKPEVTAEQFDELVRPLRKGVQEKILFHTIHRRADGSDYPVEVHLQCVNDGHKKVFLAMILDITDRRKDEERLRIATTTGKLGIWDWDVEKDVISWTDPVYEIHGVTKEEFSPSFPEYAKLIHPEDRDRVRQAIKNAVEKNASYDIEFRTVNPRGEINWVFTNAVVIRQKGRAVRMLGGTMNITAQKLAEEDARKLAAIVSSSQDAIESVDLDGKFTSWNTGAEKLYGYSAEEMIGKPVTVHIPDEFVASHRSVLDRIKRGELVEPFEAKRRRKDGTVIDVAITVSQIRAEDGSLIGISKIAHDITDQKRAELERRESEERFQLLADNMDQLAWMAASDGSTMWFNKRWEEFSGIPIDEIRERSATELHHPDHFDRITKSLAECAEKGQAWECEFPLKRKDGEWRWFLSRAIPVRNSEGVIYRWFGTSTDMTEQRKAQEVLQQNEARFHQLADGMAQLAWVASPAGTITWFNKRWYEYTGTSPDDLPNAKWGKVVHPDHLDIVRKNWERSFKDGLPFEMEFPILGSDGEYRSFLTRVNPVRDAEGRIDQWFGTNTDITEIKKATASLRESEERLRSAFNQSAAGFAQTDPQGRLLQVNDYFCQTLGYTEEELLSKRLQDITHPEDLALSQELFDRAVREGRKFDLEKRYVRKDGQPVWVHVSGAPIATEKSVDHILLVTVDVTERKRAEALVRESEARFRQMADNAPVLIWISDTAKNFNWFNKPWLDFVGRPMQKELGSGWIENIHPEDLDRALQTFHTSFDQRIPFNLDFRMKRHDGEYRWIFDHGTPIHDGEGRFLGYIGSCMDIHTRKEAEQALAEAARQKDQFLATLAHELRNPLAPIRNGLQLLEIAGADEELHTSTRAMMDRQMNHLVRLVDDLMDLSRISRGKIELRPEQVDLASIVETAVESSRPLIQNREHQLIVQLADEPLIVNGDAMRLTQSVANLLNNAAKYTPRGGRIEVKLTSNGSDAMIHVKDNGIGIESDQLTSIFDMFTQVHSDQRTDPGGGLGIGLNIVQQLSLMHGGNVRGYSEGKGRGSEFVITLPLLKEIADRSPARQKRIRSLNGIRKRILVVDDNHDAAMSMGLLLQKQGHEVHLAHDGTEAIRMAEALLPDVIFMDIGMPVMNGFEACEAVRSAPWGKDLFVVALSGWGQQRDMERSKQAGFDAHYVKPIAMTDLDELLNRSRN